MSSAADSTAVRVALWRALHVELDPPPHVLEDTVGLRLAAPDEGWRARPDMHPEGTAPFRASIVARARFVEDLVIEAGLPQYVILGAGLDTFAQRRADVASKMRIFEVDRPGPQAWKRQRLVELGYGVPDFLRLVPVDFEAGASWSDELVSAGFDVEQPALVASLGVTPYLTREATTAMLRAAAGLAAGSILVASFLVPRDRLPPEEQPALDMAVRGAQASGTPFIGFYAPEEMVALAGVTGLRDARHVSPDELAARYGLPLSHGEHLVVARA